MSAPRFGDVYLISSAGGAPEPRLIVSSDFHLTVQSDIVLTVLLYPAELIPDAWRSVPVELPENRGGAHRALLDRVFAVGQERLGEQVGSLTPEAASDARAALSRIFLG